jgi:hypothetical protein
MLRLITIGFLWLFFISCLLVYRGAFAETIEVGEFDQTEFANVQTAMKAQYPDLKCWSSVVENVGGDHLQTVCKHDNIRLYRMQPEVEIPARPIRSVILLVDTSYKEPKTIRKVHR